MLEIKKIKKQSRNNLKNHYWYAIIVCFIVTIIIGGYKFNTEGIPNTINLNNSNLDIVNNFVNYIKSENIVQTVFNYKPTRGVLAVFFNQITGTGSIIIGVLNVINQFFFSDNISFASTLIIYLLLSSLIYIFIQNVIIVCKNRFFLERRRYKETSINKLLFIYKIRKTFNVAEVMIMKTIYSFLWWFTIIGGIIKYYEYSMIPYILAENPSLNYKGCFKLSKKLTNKNKFKIFKIDVSLVGWYILGGATLGLSNIFYFNAYRESIYANIYMELRNDLLNKNDEYKKYLKDIYLDKDGISYPIKMYFIPEVKKRKWVNIDYKRNYSVQNLILLFFTFSFVGWIWEVSTHFFNTGVFVNRGALFGPWLPIYGAGGVLIIILLKKFREKPRFLFLLSVIICGTVEYGTAWYLEIFKGLKWWDYTGYFLNIQGRICLEGLLFFGFGGLAFTYLFAPILDSLFNKIKPNIKIILVSILVLLITIDFVHSHYYPNTGDGVTIEVDATEKTL